MTRIGVECTFERDGRVRVRRIELDGEWRSVAQGRQWSDDTGRHVLVMLSGEQIEELVLRAADLTWHLVPRRQGRPV